MTVAAPLLLAFLGNGGGAGGTRGGGGGTVGRFESVID
jgi:hypothetical protein